VQPATGSTWQGTAGVSLSYHVRAGVKQESWALRCSGRQKQILRRHWLPRMTRPFNALAAPRRSLAVLKPAPSGATVLSAVRTPQLQWGEPDQAFRLPINPVIFRAQPHNKSRVKAAS
jgi:hypothetical protein